MFTKKTITRRRMMKVAAAGASSIVAGAVLPGRSLMADTGSTASKATVSQVAVKQKCPDAPRIRGPFPILSTPFTDSGEVDYEVLAREARFAEWCGSPGMIWPQSNDSVDLLTREEKFEGMEVLARTSQHFRATALCLGVQGKDTDDMLVYAKYAEKLSPAAIISRPPDSGKTQDDLRQYWSALAKVAKRPVIIQTSGRGPAPSNELLFELGKEFPNLGYVKEERGGGDVPNLVASPSIRRVFSAKGAVRWLYESRLGAEGLITERLAYADILAQIWQLMQSGKDPAKLKDMYSKLVLMINLKNTHPDDLRGFSLYILKMRGVFRNMISRHYGPNFSTPPKPNFSELKLSGAQIDEIEWRFESLKPYLKPGKFEG